MFQPPLVYHFLWLSGERFTNENLLVFIRYTPFPPTEMNRGCVVNFRLVFSPGYYPLWETLK